MKLNRFIKSWLVHSLVIWVLVNKADIFIYMLTADNLTTPFADLWARFLNHNLHQGTLPQILFFCLLAEYNYRVVFFKYKYKMLAFAGVTIALSALLTLALLLYTWYFSQFFVPASILMAPVAYILYAGFYIFLRNYFEGGKARAEQQQQKTAAELQALKAQLNPHFFFNALNTVYGTALQENAPKTAEITDKLSSLVRYVMEKTKDDLTAAADEITFIDDYFALQQVRLPVRENIGITKNVDCETPSLMLAPLLFIPFIENAFKYGISIERDCFINLTLSIKNNIADMLLENTIIPTAAKPGDGTGIANAEKRLQLLYPAAHTLKISRDNNVFSVKLHINF